MSARLNSSRTSLLIVNRLNRQNARLLELLYLACALLLGALLAATTLAAPRQPAYPCSPQDERAQIRRATASPIVHLAHGAAAPEFDSQ